MTPPSHFRDPLAIVRGLGSGKDGTHHWLAQRVSALLLVPLFIWFLTQLSFLTSSDYATVISWASRPLHASLLLLMVCLMIYHGYLGLRVIIEDYVHHPFFKYMILIVLKGLSMLLASLTLISIIRILFLGLMK